MPTFSLASSVGDLTIAERGGSHLGTVFHLLGSRLLPEDNMCALTARLTEGVFVRSFPKPGGGLEGQHRALDLDDRGNKRLPFGAGHRRGSIEHADGAGFVTIAPFGIDGANAGKRGCLLADGFGPAVQNKLVVLQLDDEMRVRRRRGLEGFF